MHDAYVVGDPDGLSPLLQEVRDAVARELHAQLAMRADRLDLADLPEVAYQVTLRVDDVLSRRRPATAPRPSSPPLRIGAPIGPDGPAGPPSTKGVR